MRPRHPLFVALSARGTEIAALPYGELRLLEVVTLAARPRRLLLDEPISAMNPVETRSFMGLLSRIREQGVVVPLVEHDMNVVMSVSGTRARRRKSRATPT